ncbi:hypothetical protein DSO57_1005871 [Entomophthora muscae]|uniref:Uncharacterized protein n=1 Tax=Entomophthora muscae TaxID=34485 RepID=A0ACC2RMG2_9FUNG|nr:hypothetical protein DSO57_1005871 [Entomophthora muscae]
MPRNYYLIAGIVYFCSNLIILFTSICESTTQYKLAYPYPPGHTPVVLAKPLRAFDLEYFHPHHLDLPSVMKDIPTAPPLPDAPPTQDFSKLGFVYITVLGLADQVVPHTWSWRPLATALRYLVCIAPIVYMAFQARPASPVEVQSDSSIGRDKCPEFYTEDALMLSQVIYLGLLWLGLIVLLNPGVTIGNFTKKYLKLRWWLIINSMWIWVVIPHHLETASYYPVISVTTVAYNMRSTSKGVYQKHALSIFSHPKKTMP